MADTSAVASWFTRETINEINDTDIDIHLEGDPLGVTPIARIPKYNDPKLREANAALICDAVNNTANKGINPNAVPGLLEALKYMGTIKNLHEMGIDINTFLNSKGYTKIKQAIKSAELKQ